MEVADISVVIPAYGRCQYLERALESIATQSVLPREVIIVDDASPVPISVPVGNRGDWPFETFLIRSSCNGGAAVARNIGSEKAASNFIVYLDADDAMMPHYLEFIAGKWDQAEHDVGLLAVGFYWCDDMLEPYRAQTLPDQTAITKDDLLRRANFVGGCSVLSVRASALRAVGGFPPLRACQDWGLMLAILARYRILCYEKPCVLYMSPTFNHGSMTRNARRAILAICGIYGRFDGAGRGRAFQIKSSLIFYHLIRGRRVNLARRVFVYSFGKFRHADILMLKGCYEFFAPSGLRRLVARIRRLGARSA